MTLSNFQKDKLKTLFRQGNKVGLGDRLRISKDIQFKTIFMWIKAGDIKVADMSVLIDAVYVYHDDPLLYKSDGHKFDDLDKLVVDIIERIK